MVWMGARVYQRDKKREGLPQFQAQLFRRKAFSEAVLNQGTLWWSLLGHTGLFDGGWKCIHVISGESGIPFVGTNAQEEKLIGWKLGYLDTSVAWKRIPGVMLSDPVSTAFNVVSWVRVPEQVEAGREWLHSCHSQLWASLAFLMPI